MTRRRWRKTVADGVGACVVAAAVPDAAVAQSLAVDTLFEVGVLEGDACQTFGRIGSAAVDGAGRVVVVVELNRAVRVFGRDGRSAPSEQAADEQYPQLGAVDADGYLLCAADAGVIGHAILQRPIVRAYGLDGAERWRVEIPDYRAARIAPGDNGSVRFTAPGSGGLPDLTAGLTAIDPDRALLQFGTVAGLRVFDAVRSLELDLATGSFTPLTMALPVILSSRADLLVASETDHYPIVLLLRRER